VPSTERKPQRPWRTAGLVIAFAILVAPAGPPARAEPTVPWTPSPAARHALELLVDDGGLALPVTQWPLPRFAVVRALDALPRELAPGLAAARTRSSASWVMRHGQPSLRPGADATRF
jgi:hypothetical protein